MRPLWRYSRADAVLLLLTLLQFVATLSWGLSFGRLAWGWNLAVGIALAYFHFYNTIVATHSFIHCPFFTRKRLNQAFSVANSVNLMVPQVLYRFHHILHHRFNNDCVRDGTTKDPSSTWRYGAAGRHEHVVRYALAGLFRGTSFAYDEVKKRGEIRQYYLELGAILAASALYLWVDWRFFCFGLVPMFYASWCMTHVENYYDHYRCANPDDRFANSVSYYGRLFNFVYFNEGYHQEHHVHPSCHWTKRRELVEELRPKLSASGCKPARFPSLLGFLE